MSDDEVVRHIGTVTDMVHVSDAGAYEAFAQGKVIFDISPDGGLLDQFIVTLESEFGAAPIQRKPLKLPSFPGVQIHTVYHKHKAIEVAVLELGKIEDESLG